MSRITVDKFSRDEWSKYSEQAHLICFGTHKPAAWDKFDFALVARTEETLLGYMTCREISKEAVFLEFGGAFPGTKGGVNSWYGLKELLHFLAHEGYSQVVTMVENGNYPMLKMYIKLGAKVIGTRAYEGSVLLEHLLDLKQSEKREA